MVMEKDAAGGAIPEMVGQLSRIADALEELVRAVKEERESSPHTPLIEKGDGNNNPSRAREEFIKPTVEEVAAHIREMGYVFDAETFWNYYESKDWHVGPHVMKSWRAVCVTWQKKCEHDAMVEAARTAHIDAKMDAREKKRETQMASRRRPSNWIAATPEQIKEFCDGLR